MVTPEAVPSLASDSPWDPREPLQGVEGLSGGGLSIQASICDLPLPLHPNPILFPRLPTELKEF